MVIRRILKGVLICSSYAAWINLARTVSFGEESLDPLVVNLLSFKSSVTLRVGLIIFIIILELIFIKGI